LRDGPEGRIESNRSKQRHGTKQKGANAVHARSHKVSKNLQVFPTAKTIRFQARGVNELKHNDAQRHNSLHEAFSEGLTI
jgi:hypothetical protein